MRRLIFFVNLLGLSVSAIAQFANITFKDAKTGVVLSSETVTRSFDDSTGTYLFFRQGYKTMITTELKSIVVLEQAPAEIKIISPADKLPISLPQIEIAIDLKDKDAFGGKVYVENWDSVKVANQQEMISGYIRFPVSSTVFPRRDSKINIWLTGKDPYYPFIGQIALVNPVLSDVQFTKKIKADSAKTITLAIDVRDARGPVNGYIISEHLKYQGQPIQGEPFDPIAVENGKFEAIIDNPPDNKLRIRFYNEELMIGSFKVDTTMTISIPPGSTELAHGISFPYSVITKMEKARKNGRPTESEDERLTLLLQETRELKAIIESRLDKVESRISKQETMTNSIKEDLYRTNSHKLKEQSVLDAILNDLPKAQMAFNAPDTMEVGETSQVILKISRQVAAASLENQIRSSVLDTTRVGLLYVETFRISEKAEAHLTGAGIKTKAISPVQQVVLKQGTTTWEWAVTADQEGTGTLYLTLNALIELGDQRITQTIQTYRRKVFVYITNTTRILNWLNSNRDLIGGFVSGVLLAVLTGRLSGRRKEQKESLSKQKQPPDESSEE